MDFTKGPFRAYCPMCGEEHEADRPCITNTPRQSPPRDPLLVEREKTHGSYKDAAAYWYKCTNVDGKSKQQNMTPAQRHALCMIHTKIARILFGNPNEKDHWLDIAGYAKLGAEACE